MSQYGWRLERTYLSGAGLAESRLEGLDITWSDVEAPSGHSALWADNGTGKTMITALRFALYLPHSREFVRGESDRSLAKLVQSGDVCHVVEQATRVVHGELQRIVVGMAASWGDGGTQDLDNPSRLVRTFYGWLGGPDGPTMEALPFRTSAGRWSTHKQYVGAVRELLPHGGAAPPFTPSEHQRHWQEWLMAAGVDLDQVRFQTVMNASEGGVDRVMRFIDSDAFVRWLIGATMPTSTVDQITNSIETLRVNAAARPRWEDELGLWKKIIDPLLNLAIAHDNVSQNRHEVATAHADAAMVVADADATISVLATTREAARERFKHHDHLRREAGAMLRRAQAHRLRMQLRAAQLRADDAERVATSRHEEYRAALRHLNAWQHVEHVLAAREARGRIWALEEQIAAAEKETDELRRDEAALRHALARLLTHRRDTATHQLEAATKRAEEAKKSLSDLDVEIETCVGDHATAKERVRTLDEQIRTANSTIEAAVTAGVLPEEANPATVDAELRDQHDAAHGERDRSDASLSGLEPQLRQERAALTAAHRRAATARDDISAATSELRAVERRIDALTSDERMLEVAGTTVDPWIQQTDLTDRFLRRAHRADADTDVARAAAAAAQRVIDGVGEDGLLPPSALAEECSRRCQAAEIPAWPGWRWMADIMRPADAEVFASTRPDIASGVVVSHPSLVDRAVEAIGELKTDVALWVGAVIDPARAVRAGDKIDGTHAHVLLPHPGTYDRAAVSSMVEEATVARATADRELDAAEQRGRAAREMLAELAQLWKDLPDDPRRRLAEKIENAEKRRMEAEAAADTHEGNVGRLEQTEQEHKRARASAQQTIESTNQRRLLLAPVVAAASILAAARTELPARRETVRALGQRLTELKPERNQRAGDVRDAETRVAEYERARDDLTENLRAAGLAATTDGPVPSENQTDIEGRLTGVRAAINDAAIDTELHAELDRERRRLSEADSRLGSDAELRALADELADTDRARHPVALRSCIGRAEERKNEAQTEYAQAAQAAKAARSDYERRAADTADRSWPDVDDLPSAAIVASALEADRIANRLDDMAGELLETQRQEGSSAEAATKEGDQADHALELLRVNVKPLRHLTEPGATGRPTHDPHDLGRRIDGVAERVRATEVALHRSQEEERRTSDQVRSHANSTLARKVEDRGDTRVVDFILRLRGDEQLPAEAERIAGHLEQRAASLSDDLAHHDEDVRTCATMLHVQAERAIQRLRSYQNQSRLPEGLGDWSDHQFVDISHPGVPDDESVAVDRVARVVHAQLAPGGGRSDARAMLFAAARALVDGPFRVRLLKPHIDLAVQRVDVAELKNFSGGQRVTAGVLLYATMTRVRAAGNDAASIGWLWLDNPFGQASADQFVRTMRLVADRLKLQLVFTAAPKDKGALSMFDRVTALSRRSRPSSGEKVIVVEDDRREVVDLDLIQRDVMAVLGE